MSTVRPTLRDLGVAAALAVLAALAILIGMTPSVRIGSSSTPWWHLLPALVVCAGITVQRRFPRTVLAVTAAALTLDAVWGASLGVMLGVWEVLYTATLIRSWPFAMLMRRAVVALAVGSALVVGIVATELRDAASTGLLVGAVLVTPVWWGIDVRRQQDIAALIEANSRQERRAAVQDERARMARDLHDAVAGDLASIAIHAEAGLRSPDTRGGAHDALTAIRGSSVRAVGELTRMILLLRREGDPQAEDATTAPGIDRLSDLVEHARAGGADVRWQVGELPPLPIAVEHAVYRITQEALTNATRHGRGPIRVTVAADENDARLVVTNSVVGQPDPATRGSGLGLLTMRERAEGLGGEFSSGPVADAPQQQWQVRASIPLNA